VYIVLVCVVLAAAAAAAAAATVATACVAAVLMSARSSPGRFASSSAAECSRTPESECRLGYAHVGDARYIQIARHMVPWLPYRQL
jgi:hypothetical protein